TYADKNDRVTLFNESKLLKGFIRTETILGRRIEFCHPPRLEKLVRETVDELKAGKAEYREFWTRQGDRILRVLIVAVKNDRGEYLGTLEIVEDFTDVINNVEEIKKKIVVL
ncbi:MAG: PAS domain-containing protein, partial [Ignisphaera sp.]